LLKVSANTQTRKDKMTILDLRKRALAVISTRFTANTLTEDDYLLDDIARRLSNLPALPVGDKPYEGWLSEKPVGAIAPNCTSKAGIDLIKKWEGCRTNAYKCPAGVWTIGYGHTSTAKPGMMISPLDAEDLLREDLARFEAAVKTLVTVPLTQHQFDALVSFTYNVGIGAFRKSTLLVKVNAKHYAEASGQFRRWTNANGKELPGLVARRKDECALFLKP
jgi:lysozyme